MKMYGKKDAIAALDRFAQSGRIPHALLLCGEEGIGKRTLARYIAMMYMCPNRSNGRPCMQCRTCSRIGERIHPDVVDANTEVTRLFDAMPKDQKNHVKALRQFISKCYTKPNDGDVRIIIFGQLDDMSVQEQNTLLKCIEEPLEFNRYIFTAANKTPILQTVLSRVVAVNVDEADETGFTAALAENGIPAGRAAELYEMCGGNIGAALKLEESGGEIPYRTAAVKVAEAIAAGAELDCLAALNVLKKREDIFDTLGILSDIFAAATASKAGKAISGAFAKESERLASRLGSKALTRLYDETVKLYGLSFTNPNVKLFAAECTGKLFGTLEGR